MPSPDPTARRLPALVGLTIALVTVGIAPAAQAQQPITLREAIERAIAGNRDLVRERIAIAQAEAGAMGALGQFDFQLSSNLTFTRSTTPPLSSSDVSGGQSDRLSGDLRLSRPLETGGNIGLTLRGGGTDTTSRFACGDLTSTDPSCQIYDASLALDFRHPLLRGFGREITLANLRKQRIQKDLALLNRSVRASSVVRDVIAAYWELAYAAEELSINRSAVDLAREQLRFTEAQIQVGRAAPLEAAAAQRAIAERLQQVALSEQALFFRTMDLRRLLGLATEVKTVPFVAADAPQASPREVDVDSELRAALDNNPQLKSLRLGLSLTDIDLETSANLLRPQLDVVGSFGATGRNTQFGEAVAQTGRLEERTWSAGLSFSMPLENRSARAGRELSNLAVQLSRLGVEELELTIREAVLRTTLTIQTATRRLDLARQAVGFAEQDLEAEKARFSVGRSTSNEILRRQQDLKAAQIQIVRATVDLLRSETELGTLNGNLLPQQRIELR